jgi:hypothetical protein
MKASALSKRSRASAAQLGGLGLGDILEQLRLVAALVEPTAREQLVEHHADREQIRARIDNLAAGLLGRQVAELAHRGARLDVAVRLHVRDAEVAEDDAAVERQEHVVRRDVAMHEAERRARLAHRLVDGLEPLEQLVDDEHREVGRELEPARAEQAHELQEVHALHELHRDVVAARDLARVVGLDEVRVVEEQREVGLGDEEVEHALVLPALFLE